MPMTRAKRKNGIIFSLGLALIIAIMIIIDIRSVAPEWTIYAEFFGVTCAAFSAWLYYNDKAKEN